MLTAVTIVGHEEILPPCGHSLKQQPENKCLWTLSSPTVWWGGRLLRVPRTARRSNQSILKEISAEYSLEGLMLKLKLQCFGHLMRRTDSLKKTLMLGKIEGRRRRGWQRIRWLDGIPAQWTWVWVCSGSWWWTGRPGVLQSMGSQNWTWLRDWTELNWLNRSREPNIVFSCLLTLWQYLCKAGIAILTQKLTFEEDEWHDQGHRNMECK